MLGRGRKETDGLTRRSKQECRKEEGNYLNAEAVLAVRDVEGADRRMMRDLFSNVESA